MRVLITGGAGQLGLILASELEKIKWIELLVSDRKTLDIADARQVGAYFKRYLPDVVINAAAFTSVDAAENMHLESFSVNHLGAANLARSSANHGAAVIQLSTDYVFDGGSDRPYTESDLPNPLNVYGKSKLEGEKAVIQFNSKHIILRTSWLFSETGKSFYSTMLNLMETKKSISVVNDQMGAPTVVLDLVGLISKILEMLHQYKELNWGVYHYSGYPFTSWFGFAKQIQATMDPRSVKCEIKGVSTEFYTSSVKRPLYSCLDSSKACDYFFVKPSDWLSALEDIAIKAKSK